MGKSKNSLQLAMTFETPLTAALISSVDCCYKLSATNFSQ
jgi:hypothetical protein